MKYLSLFSGIGTGEQGIEQAFQNIHNAGSRSELLTQGVCDSRMSASRESGQSAISRDNACNDGGGARRMLENIGYAEIDKTASAIYRYHWPEHTNLGDATAIVCDDLADFDFLIAGFPCQSFSIAGKRQGFNEARGTLFFEIARILSHKRPRHFLLENVKGLLSSNDGKDFPAILRILSDLNYRVETVVLNSKHYGVPQNRERVFFIGHSGDGCEREILSFGDGDGEFDEERRDTAYCLDANYFKGCNDVTRNSRTIVDSAGSITRNEIMQLNNPTHSNNRVYAEGGTSPALNTAQGGNRQPFVAMAIDTKNVGDARFTENVACLGANDYKEPKGVMLSDRRIRRLTPVECERLQGCPDGFTQYGRYGDEIKEMSDTARYKGLGNSFTVNVIKSIVTRMIEKGCLEKELG